MVLYGFAHCSFLITAAKDVMFSSVCLSVKQDYSKTTDQIFKMKFYVIIDIIIGSIDYILIDLDARSLEVKGHNRFLRITPLETAVQSRDKNYNVAYSVL